MPDDAGFPAEPSTKRNLDDEVYLWWTHARERRSGARHDLAMRAFVIEPEPGSVTTNVAGEVGLDPRSRIEGEHDARDHETHGDEKHDLPHRRIPREHRGWI